MNFFKFFSNNNNNTTSANKAENIDTVTESTMDESVSSNNEAPKTDTISITYGTGLPIDIIYGYMRKNYSEQGFQDAVTTPDMTFKEINKQIIQNKVLVVFKQVKLKYEVMITAIDQRINSCQNAGLVGTIFQLQHEKDVLSHHLEEVNSLETKFRCGDSEATSCLQTYEVGFLKGLAASAIGATKSMMGEMDNINNN